MYVNDNHFDGWMEKLTKAIHEIGKDLKLLVNTKDIFLTSTMLHPKTS